MGTVPGDVITDGFIIRQDWARKNFLVTIDPSLRGRSGAVSWQIVAEAMFAASSGRPGPVDVGLPEDVIRMHVDPTPHPVIPVAPGGMTVTDWKALRDALMESEKPLFVTGGNDWTQEGVDELTRWLEEHHIAAAVEWRCEGNIPFSSPSYVGPIGYGRPKPTYDLLE